MILKLNKKVLKDNDFTVHTVVSMHKSDNAMHEVARFMQKYYYPLTSIDAIKEDVELTNYTYQGKQVIRGLAPNFPKYFVEV